MRIQPLERVEVTRLGVPGDRAFFLVDENGAMVNGKRFGSLMEIVPEHDPGARLLTLVLPDGSRVTSGVSPGATEKATFFGDEVTARPVSQELSAAISDHVGS